MKNSNLSIIIPILNEERNILPLTKNLIKNLKKFNYEIIFVDDGSEDDSQSVLNLLKIKYKFFKPLIRNKNRDLTQSCFDGIQKSKYSNILIMDGDLQHDPKYISKMFTAYRDYDYDIVIGARNLLKGTNPGLSELRRMASVILISLFSIFKIKTQDPMSGFFIFKKKIYKDNKSRLFGKGFKILIDFIMNSKNNLKTKDIFINFKRRHKNQSKMNYKIFMILIQFYLVCLIKKIFN